MHRPWEAIIYPQPGIKKKMSGSGHAPECRMTKHLLALTCAAAALPSQAAEHSEIKTLTFNLRYINAGDTGARMWTERRDAAAAVVQREAADFVGVQEAFRQMLDDVKARTPGYTEVGVGREDGKERGEYSAILFRNDTWTASASGTFWLSDTPEVPGSATWGNTVTRICTWGQFRHKTSGKEVFVYNAHFDHQSQECREKGAALILQRIAARGSSAPVIFMGDLNATPDNPAIAAILKGPPAFTDVWQHLNPKVPAVEAGTFHQFTGKKEGPRIDYIFASPGLTPVESAILRDNTAGHYPSDHFPVRAVLRIAPNP